MTKASYFIIMYKCIMYKTIDYFDVISRQNTSYIINLYYKHQLPYNEDVKTDPVT